VPLRLFFTGDTAGYLAPCGCELGQYGGIARRATYLKRVRRGDDLVVDLGNLVSGEGPTQEVVLAWSLEGLQTLGCDALVPGEGEIRLGRAFEDAVRARAAPRVVCANWLRADGSRVFEPWILKPLADGRTAALVGVAQPFAGAPSAYRISSAADAVRDAMKELAGRASVVVVAGALREDATRGLAAQFKDVALVVGGWATRGSPGVVETGGAPAMLVGEYAFYVGRVDLDASLVVHDARQAWLDESVPDDPDAAGIVARYKADVAQNGASFTTRLVASLREQKYVGSAPCMECHMNEFAVWTRSAHSHAMRTLAAKNAERDPQCVKCHLGDVPRQTWYDDAPPPDEKTLGVGCETCHGGGARHVEFARRGANADAVRALAPATREACVRCHVPPNATRFDFERDWRKIAHGRGVGK